MTVDRASARTITFARRRKNENDHRVYYPDLEARLKQSKINKISKQEFKKKEKLYYYPRSMDWLQLFSQLNMSFEVIEVDGQKNVSR